MDEPFVNSLLPQFLQTWLQNAFWLEVLQNAMIILLIVVAFSLLYAMLDLILLCRQEFKNAPQRAMVNLSATTARHHWLTLRFPSLHKE